MMEPGDKIRSTYGDIYELQENGSWRKLGRFIGEDFHPNRKLRKKERKKYKELITKEVRETIQEWKNQRDPGDA